VSVDVFDVILSGYCCWRVDDKERCLYIACRSQKVAKARISRMSDYPGCRQEVLPARTT